MLGPFFPPPLPLSFSLPLGTLFFSFSHPPRLPLHHRRLSGAGVCLMKLSREGPSSFCPGRQRITRRLQAARCSVASSALFSPAFRFCFYYPPCLFHDNHDQPFQHFPPAKPALLVASVVVYTKVARCRVEWLKDVSRRTVCGGRPSRTVFSSSPAGFNVPNTPVSLIVLS